MPTLANAGNTFEIVALGKDLPRLLLGEWNVPKNVENRLWQYFRVAHHTQ